MRPVFYSKRINISGRNPALEGLRLSFADAKRFTLKQDWLPEPEAGFRQASVATGWNEAEFLIFAELEDDDIYSEARGLNDETWEKGDVFEIFLRNAMHFEYQEFHITPHNCKFQMRIPSLDELVDRERRHGIMSKFELTTEVFQSQVWLEDERWSLLARIPLGELQLPADPVGHELIFSFSRYDFTRGFGSMLSSTSRHQVANFHRQHEWDRLILSEV